MVGLVTQANQPSFKTNCAMPPDPYRGKELLGDPQVAAHPVINSSCGCHRFQDQLTLYLHRYLRSVVLVAHSTQRLDLCAFQNQGFSSLLHTISQPCGDQRIRRPLVLQFLAVQTWCCIRLRSCVIIASLHPKARCPPRCVTLSNPSQPTLLTNDG